MNWELVKWVAGVLLTTAGIKFVWTAFRTLFSKDNMQDVLEAVGERCHDSAEKGAEMLKEKVVRWRSRQKIKKAEKANKPIVYIR